VVNYLTGEIIYTLPPPEDMPQLMKELVEWLNEETDISPVLLAGITQYQFVEIHPFLDGNGRTAYVHSFSIRMDMISKDSFRYLNITIEIDGSIIMPFNR
jgi:hypothetical protein